MYNDNELLYLISEKDDEALELLVNKYKPMITSKIYLFNIDEFKKEDGFQIGLEVLYKAIELYQTEQKMSFNRFFELLLERKFIDVYRSDKARNFVVYNNDLIKEVIDTNSIEENKQYYYFKNDLSSFEKEVFEKFYIEKKKIHEIANDLSCERRKIYDAINRIKRKLA